MILALVISFLLLLPGLVPPRVQVVQVVQVVVVAPGTHDVMQEGLLDEDCPARPGSRFLMMLGESCAKVCFLRLRVMDI